MINYNIYCDESCHLEHDGMNVMVLGAVWCPNDAVREINKCVRDIKKRNGVSPTAEMKWTKISPAKVQLYTDFVNYFFDDERMHLRAVIIPDKGSLDHERFGQTHDDWYYKMYFEMLKQILTREDLYDIYIDIKDTRSNHKAQKLREVLSNANYDFQQKIVRRLQPIRSEEVEIMQLVDILIGALGYANRKFTDSH
ncbi:MAG TPA: DUF3800 domain-containing protein, partial [Ruminococcaceae bacterium]|nr:DUF3800 domain-containing protein [Oscillospiraceae bacterium]